MTTSPHHTATDMDVPPHRDPGMPEGLTELLAREEAKRERNWDPQMRWKVIQETLAWCAAQATVLRNTPAACLAEQLRKLAWLAAREAKGENS